MRGWGATVTASRVKTNNSASGYRAKVELRRQVGEAIGFDRLRVLDLYAGNGEMYRGIWCEAAHYVGCDLEWFRDDRLAYVVDNRRLLRAIDLMEFNAFDFDAHGSPWEQIYIFARRHGRLSERIGLVITEGSSLKLRQQAIPSRKNLLPHALALMAGLRRDAVGVNASYGDVVRKAIVNCGTMLGAKPVHIWGARKPTGSQVGYFGVVLDPV